MPDRGGGNGGAYQLRVPDREGAHIRQQYHESTQHIVGVPVTELKYSNTYAIEEIGLFALGDFLVSGALWLGIERLATEGYQDVVFWWCAGTVVVGGLLVGLGLYQISRRVKRLLQYVPQGAKD